MIKIIFCQKQLSGVDMSCKYKYRAFDAFDSYIKELGFKDITYKNGIRKIWLTKTDYKYVLPFLGQLRIESVPFELSK